LQRFKFLEIAGVLHDIAILETALEGFIKERGPGVPVDDFNHRTALLDVENAIIACSGNEGLKPALETAQRCKRNLSAPSRHPTVGELETEVRAVREAIWSELRRETVMAVPRQYADRVDKQDLFGAAVSTVSPEAAVDIRDAGNCLAFDLPTAAVFHLVRIAEHGLRRLAKKLRVRLTHKGKLVPLDYADWNKVITGIRGRIDKARGLSPGPKKQGQLDLYSRLADQCEYMKDIWRNDISHARRTFTIPEADGVYGRVCDFMQAIAAIG
jgi:hypothetical protein